MNTRLIRAVVSGVLLVSVACGGGGAEGAAKGGGGDSVVSLAVQKSGSGSGTISGAGIDCGASCSVALAQGTVVTLTAMPDPGSTFAGWNGCDSTDGTTCTCTMTASETVIASFTTAPADQYTLTVQKSGPGSGTVSGGGGISCGGTCSASFAQDATVELTAAQDAGSTFAGWSGCDSTTGTTCTVTMSGDRTVIASFTAVPANQCTLTVQKSGSGSGNVSGGGGISCGGTCSASFAQDATVELTAAQDAGSTFAGWSGCDSTAGTTCTVTMSGDRTVTASFTGPCWSPDQTLCATPTGPYCFYLAVDPNHCGSCGHACATEEICQDGTCTSAPSCPSGLTYCDPDYWGGYGDGTVCFDLENDVHNCGQCRTWCHTLGLGEGTCQSGRCVWP